VHVALVRRSLLSKRCLVSCKFCNDSTDINVMLADMLCKVAELSGGC